MVRLGPRVFYPETESTSVLGQSTQILGGKGRKRKTPRGAPSAFSANWFGAIIPLRKGKLPECDAPRTFFKSARLEFAVIACKSATYVKLLKF